MEEQLISFKTAKLAKEKGFDVCVNKCYGLHSEIKYTQKHINDYEDTIHISAPTQTLLQKWLREVHKIIVLVDWEGTDGYFYKLDFKSFYEVAGNNNKNYEDCLELGLQEALKLI